MTIQQPTNRNNESLIGNAKNLFRYLAEIKALQSANIRDYRKYEKVIWLADIPREQGCFCAAWGLFGEPGEIDSSDAWISVQKPNLTSPPQLPEDIRQFVNLKEWRNSSLSQPSLQESDREQLIGHFLPNEGLEFDVKELHINEHENIFEEYARYIDEEWCPWALAKRSGENVNEARLIRLNRFNRG